MSCTATNTPSLGSRWCLQQGLVRSSLSRTAASIASDSVAGSPSTQPARRHDPSRPPTIRPPAIEASRTKASLSAGGCGYCLRMPDRDAGLDARGRIIAPTGWTFLTNHAHVLLTIARDPQITLREVATLVRITERAVQKIVADLENSGYLTRTRHGRRNSYAIAPGRPFRHPVTSGHEVDELLKVLAPTRRAD